MNDVRTDLIFQHARFPNRKRKTARPRTHVKFTEIPPKFNNYEFAVRNLHTFFEPQSRVLSFFSSLQSCGVLAGRPC